MSTTTEATTTTTTTVQEDSVPTNNRDVGADFRASNPIQPTKTEPAGEPKEGDVDKKPSADSKDTKRFGIAGKPASKISFRILTNLSLLLKPYGGQSKPNEFCIKPGGANGAIKPFTSSSGRKQFKKVGIRISYSIKQLLSIRHKLQSFPSDIDVIPDVLVEGLGDFETLTAQTVTLSSSSLTMSPSKLRKSKLKSSKLKSSKLKLSKLKSSSDKTKSAKVSPQNVSANTSTAATATTYANSTRYDGNDEDASFRQKKTVTPSKINVSKLKKREKLISPNTEIKPIIETQEETQSLTEITKEKEKEIVKEKEKPSPQKEESSHAYIAKNISSTDAEQVSKPKKSSKPLSSLSSGGWRRGRKTLDPKALFTAKITIRLNKITMDNFDTLSDQLIGIYTNDITNTEQLTELVTLIFEKTVQEHVYGPLYAKLCVALSAKNKSFDEVVMGSGGKRETRQVDFKNVLVKVCQKEFQKGKRKAVITSGMDKTDRANEEIKQKKILLGTMKFIGQLYLKQLIPSKIMIVCLEHLVGGVSGKPTEDDIEGACSLIETIGKTLDDDQTVNSPELRKYYQKLESIERNSAKYSPRIRILIQNLIDLRKNGWKGSQLGKPEPRALSQKKSINKSSTIYDPFDEQIPLQFNLAQLAMGGVGDDALEMITTTNVPISVVHHQSQRKFRSTNRYSKQQPLVSSIQNNNHDTASNAKQIYQERSTTSGSRKAKGRKLLEIEDEELHTIRYTEEKETERKQSNIAQPTQAVSIGKRKSRIPLSSGSTRPCDEGKALDDETLSDLCSAYLNNRNNMNIDNFLTKVMKYKIESRTQFTLQFIQQAIDGGKGERLSDIIPKLLDQYILSPQELDNGFVEFFKSFTMEDNPQISSASSELLAPLIVDNELNFSDVLQWVLLDTRANQPQDDMLQYYDRDGIRNYIRKSETITKAMELLGCLLKQLKEANFEDSQFVPKLVAAYNFTIDRYMNQNDVGNNDIIKEWIDKYGIKFAF